MKNSILYPELLLKHGLRNGLNMHVSKVSLQAKRKDEDTPSSLPVKVPFPIVGIGASAGGLEAVGELLTSLPPDTGMAFIFVQHLAPDRTSLLVDLLSKKTPMPVSEATQGHLIEANHVYVIPPNTTLTVVQGCIELKFRNDAIGLPTPINDLFHSLAKDQGPNAIGISLSGSGSDGALGIQSIKNGGGITFAQDEISAQYGSMPRAAVELGCIDFVLSPPEISQELVRLRSHPLREEPSASDLAGRDYDEVHLQRIFYLLHNACNMDFTHYKRGTVKRRLSRRLALHNLQNISDYIDLLDTNPEELKALGNDFLIHVTSFFRDPDSFENLIKHVLPRLINDHSFERSLRIWVPGCSTGEEVYSIAICCLEYLKLHDIDMQIQIFGTDISEEALQAARGGVYVDNIARNVSPERLEKFFIKTGEQYQIAKSVRDLCIFARHDVTSDPPFSQLDLVSCRNLLIYLDSLLQKRVIPLFHYALKPEGVLILGPAENINGFADIFTLVDNKEIRFYIRGPFSAQSQLKYLEAYNGKSIYSPSHHSRRPLSSHPLKRKYTEAEQQKQEADRITLGRYVPASVLCDKNLNILEFRGDTSLYLTQPSGPPEINLQKLARPGLLIEISKALQSASQSGVAVRKSRLLIETARGRKEITLEVIPVQKSTAGEPWFLIFFEDAVQPSQSVTEITGFWAVLRKTIREGLIYKKNKTNHHSEDEDLSRLKEELDDTRDHILAMMEKHASAEEELRAAQEELLSSNEELQSTNEEMETAKEELQSSHEELLTTNEGVHFRNHELNELNDKLKLALNYSDAVLNTAHQPFLVLNGELHILRANPAFYKAFKTTPETTEGRLLYDLGDRQWDIPELREFLQALLLQDTSFKGCEITHAFPDVGQKTMRLNGTNLIGGEQFQILLAIEDVSDYRTALNDLNELNDKSKLALNYAEAVLNTAHQPFLVLDKNLHILRANPAFYKAFKTTPETTKGRLLYDLGDRQWDIPELREFLQALLLQDTSFKDCEITHAFPDVGQKTMRLNGTNLIGGEQFQILLAIEDVSDYRTALNTLKDNNRHKDEFLAMLAHELRNPLAPICNALEIWKSGKAGEKAEKKSQTIMGRQLQTMLRLIDDLLDVARITRGVVALKEDLADLGQIINQTVEGTRHHIEECQHEITLSLPEEKVFVKGDAIRLEQVVSNLLINACKYTKPGGHLAVTLECEAGNALIRVADNGVGISPELLPYIFDLFVQADRSLDRKQGGLGLGLTLVRRLVELQGGTVEAKSSGLGKGSEFIVRLPTLSQLEIAPVASSTALPIVPPAIRRILIVDDNLDAASTTQMLLELRGHTVQIAADGPSAFKEIEAFNPEVVFLDIGLPGMDGYEIARRLRAEYETKKILLIALSGYGQAEDVRKAKDAGFDYHLLKPASTNQIQALITDYTGYLVNAEK